ncbi:metallophosphoesterase 1 [Pararge aegeria]|uniref:Jg15400 protein n=3 Tax=Pararge aegeria TaxID=116150 RepID=A0A8S4SGH1_9NEOP|nr:metallophosphoesterase 1 [Pararge aegeria]CAH2254871.1 jg15400 [Pararge aegeria aegeria]
MRRVTKKLIILVVGLILIGLYCEFLVYYLVILQCGWPQLKAGEENVLKTFILADTHLLGPYRGHWLDKWRREWQMHQAFQAIIKLHSPEVVFILGDLFDEGEWTDEQQFNEYVDRFHKLFLLPDSIKMFVVVGNHDIGFHNMIRQDVALRFSKLLKAPSVQHLILKGNHFILLNSMALQGDSCRLCTGARRQIEKVSGKLSKCSEDTNQCYNDNLTFNYSQPILMQHFPLYRVSDAICTEPDAPPLPARNKLFRIKLDALSKESTQYIVSKIRPRVVFGGHTHHGCLVHHNYDDLDGLKFLEYSVPSFSWRNRPDPKYMLVSISPTEYAVNKCGLPTEITIILSAVIMICILIVNVIRKGTVGR